MKKVILSAVSLAAVLIVCVAVAQETKQKSSKTTAVESTQSAAKTKATDVNANARGEKPMLVPRGKTYVQLDANKREIGRFTCGQTMTETTA
ncbi:MAG: hypothetical protein H0W20_05680 [Chthoniobacterales bacterium]|nr:hypothetical protein [Chthoniobacterales bacterium]